MHVAWWWRRRDRRSWLGGPAGALGLLLVAACQASTPPEAPAPDPALVGFQSEAEAEEPEIPEVDVRPDMIPRYTVVRTDPAPARNRTRYWTQILVSRDHSRDELVAALADATRRSLRERRDARAVVVFAFTSPETVGKVYDTGRALATRDGLGWSGDTSFVPFAYLPDRGRILITLGSAVTAVEHLTTALSPDLAPGEVNNLNLPATSPRVRLAPKSVATLVTDVWLREAPGITMRALRLLPAGTKVELLGDSDEADGLRWFRVRAESRTGWIASLGLE